MNTMTYRSEIKQEATGMRWDRKLQLYVVHLHNLHYSYEDAVHKDEVDLPDLTC